MATSDRSISDVLQDIVQNIQDIVRSEIRLAKTEVRGEITKAESAGMFLGTGAICGIFGAFFVLLAIVYVLAGLMPAWTASLVVGALLLAAAAATISTGRKRLKRVHPAPDKTIGSLRENIEWARRQTR